MQIVSAVQKFRSSEAILKKPSIAETLDWAQALEALGVRELTPEIMRGTVGFVLKNNEDIDMLDEILGTEECSDPDCSGDHENCEHSHEHHHHHHHG